MSRARIIVGRTHDGRPVSRWDTPPTEDAPYGFMQPAFEPTVQRRQATPAELAASVARDTAPGYLAASVPVTRRHSNSWDAMATAERMQVSRERGVERSHEVVAARATPTQREWNGKGPKVALTAIVAEVAARYGVTLAEITGPSRRPDLVDARADAAQRMSTDPSLRLREIGDALGGRDHSTVHNLLRREVPA